MQQTGDPFESIAERMGLSERLIARREGLRHELSSLSLSEQLERFCPDAVNPYEWPTPWPRDALHKDFWPERYKRWRKYTVEAVDNAVSDTKQRFKVPEHCTCGCLKYTGEHGNCWITGNYALGHPDRGKVLPCRCKVVDERGKVKQWLLKESGINLLGPMAPSFGHWNKAQFPEASDLHDAFVDWSQDRGHNWLFVTGKPGTGKTHLSQASVLAVIGRGVRAYYMDVLQFIAEGRSKLGVDHGIEFNQWVQSIKQVPYLVIDDLGQEYSTDWTAAVLREILHYRYMHGLSTLVCSNWPVEQLDKSLGAATMDRFRDAQLCRMIDIKQGRSQRPLLDF